ncbi:hypothetical protein Taro_020741, partial [Colocasia esculenta]|nr:hypothetical protein [Colocasia esculenta]
VVVLVGLHCSWLVVVERQLDLPSVTARLRGFCGLVLYLVVVGTCTPCGYSCVVVHMSHPQLVMSLGSGLPVRLVVQVLRLKGGLALPALPVRPFGVEVLVDFCVVYTGVVQTCTTSSRVVESCELVLPRGWHGGHGVTNDRYPRFLREPSTCCARGVSQYVCTSEVLAVFLDTLTPEFELYARLREND